MSRLHSLVYLLLEWWRTLFTRPIVVRLPFAPVVSWERCAAV